MKIDYGKKLSALYGASMLSMALGFLISIFNSRVLGPENFGDYKFIETAARFIASLVTVGFFISLTRLIAINKSAGKEKKFIGLFTIIFGIASAIGITTFIIFSFVEPYFFNNGVEILIRRYFFIVLVIIGQTALAEILKGLHKIYTLSILSFLPLLIYLLLIYTIHQFYPVNIDLVLLVYYGVLLVFISAIIIGLKPNFKFEKKLVNELFEENKFNGKPIYYGSLAGVATTHIAGLSISYFMDNTQVGFFMLSLTICSPLLVIPSVLGTIYFKQFVGMNAIPAKVFYFSVLCTLLALLAFYLLIDFVIVTFYTESYLPVSRISKFLILSFVFHGLGDLINRFLGAKGKGKLLRNAAFLVGAINVLGYTLLIKFFNINGAIATKILASCLYLAVMLYYYFNFVKRSANV